MQKLSQLQLCVHVLYGSECFRPERKSRSLDSCHHSVTGGLLTQGLPRMGALLPAHGSPGDRGVEDEQEPEELCHHQVGTSRLASSPTGYPVMWSRNTTATGYPVMWSQDTTATGYPVMWPHDTTAIEACAI